MPETVTQQSVVRVHSTFLGLLPPTQWLLCEIYSFAFYKLIYLICELLIVFIISIHFGGLLRINIPDREEASYRIRYFITECSCLYAFFNEIGGGGVINSVNSFENYSLDNNYFFKLFIIRTFLSETVVLDFYILIVK